MRAEMSRCLDDGRARGGSRRPSLIMQLQKTQFPLSGETLTSRTAAQKMLQYLSQHLNFDAGAVLWLFGSQGILAAAKPRAAMPIAETRVLSLADWPLLRRLAQRPHQPRIIDAALDLEWQRAPLFRNVRSVVCLPIAAGRAALVLGFREELPGHVIPSEALQSAAWLGGWMASQEATLLQNAREIVRVTTEPGAFSAPNAETILRDALAISGRRAGALLACTPEHLSPLATVGVGAAFLQGLQPVLGNCCGACDTSDQVFDQQPFIASHPSTGSPRALIVPLVDERQQPYGALVLAYERGRRVLLEDYLWADAIKILVAYQTRALLLANWSVERAELRSRLETLTVELGNRLGFAEIFQVLCRWLPQLIPITWVGLYRMSAHLTGSDRQVPKLHEAWLNGSLHIQPLLLPSHIEPLLQQIDLSLPVCYLPASAVSEIPTLTGHPIAAAPIRVGEETIAVLLITAAGAEGFGQSHLRTLQDVSSTIALTVRYAMLFDLVQQAKQEWEGTFDAITDTVAIISPNREIRRINKTFAAERQLFPGDLVGQHCYEALYGLSAPCPQCPMTRAISSNTVAEIEVRGAANGPLYKAALFPRHNDTGEVIDVVEHAKDITFARDLQEKLMRTERLRALGEMASGAAHDFNHTLAGVLGHVDLLLQREHNPETHQGLTLIKQAASDGAVTVRRIQNFIRSQRGEEIAACDVNLIVKDAIDLSVPRWKHQSERHGITVRVREELGATDTVAGVASELRDVVVNLLLNAVEAMPHGGTITVRTFDDDRGVCLVVSDTGEGMSEETCRRIFDPFFTTKGMENSGLGMSVTYGIVKLHNGAITVESVEGQGASITVMLPRATPAPHDDADIYLQSLPEIGWKVFVVEDDPKLGDVLARLLEMDDHQVTVSTNGAEAIIRLQQEPFDLVLSDLSMPGVSGWDVVAAARQQCPTPFIALVTGWGAELAEQELRQAGVDMVIPKPFSLASIRHAFTTLAALRRRSED